MGLKSILESRGDVFMDFGKDRVYEAWKVIKNGYCKILLINLTEDTYYPILVNDAEWYQHPPLFLSAFCQWFINNNYIHPDDIKQFNSFWYDHQGYVEYRRNGYFIPVYAIVKDGVYVVENGYAKYREVIIARQDADFALITQGLDDGDIVILSSVSENEKVQEQIKK